MHTGPSRVDHPAMANACKLWRAIIRNAAFVVARRGAEHAEPFVVAVAGEDAQGITHNRVSLLSGDKWLQLAPLPHPTGHHCAVVCGGEIYVLGGHHSPRNRHTNPEPCACVMVYSPQRNSWCARPAPAHSQTPARARPRTTHTHTTKLQPSYNQARMRGAHVHLAGTR